MLNLSRSIRIPDEEIEMTSIRAQGPGGQHVNKVSSAIHLRFDIRASSLPEQCKQRLLGLSDQRISSDGIIVIKAQQFRSRDKNRADALARLRRLIEDGALREQKVRRPSKPSRSARRKRVDTKVRKGKVKALRGRVDPG